MLEGTGRQKAGPWPRKDLAAEIGCSVRAVGVWLQGSSLPDDHFLGLVERAFFGHDTTKFTRERMELREACKGDRLALRASAPSPFRAYGPGCDDPYLDEMPRGTAACYENLFKNPLERDDYDDILTWVKGSIDDPTWEWKELFCTMQERGRCIGIAFLSLHSSLKWWFGNYFGVSEDWRENDRAAKFLAFIIKNSELISRDAKGIVFEVERFNEQNVRAVLAKCDAKEKAGWPPKEAIDLDGAEQSDSEAVLRIALYTICGISGRVSAYREQTDDGNDRPPGALGVFTEESDGLRLIDYIQPAMGDDFDPKQPEETRRKEVPLWLMIYPLGPMMKKMSAQLARDGKYEMEAVESKELFDFIYDHVFPSAYDRDHAGGTAIETGIQGYARYTSELRQRVEGSLGGKPFVLAGNRILSSDARRLFTRYGQRKLGLKPIESKKTGRQ
jgi:hypothetical protein